MQRRRISAQVALLAGLVGLAGCQEYTYSDFETTDQFRQNPWEKVDVLLVVDNSCSMEPYQTKLARDFGGFFDFFDEGNVDWRIAVVHTDVFAADFGRIRGPIITPDTIDPRQQFDDVVHVGATGGGIEMGMEAAKRALSGMNHGFPRDDASVSVIFVSDEQDSSPDSVPMYADAYYDVKGQRARDAFNASALTVMSRGTCTPDQFSESSPGTRYIDLANVTGGVVGNLCQEDFTGIVHDLALTTSAMRDTFFLSHKPNLDTLEVWIGDVQVPCSAGVWHYDLVDDDGVERPAIVFRSNRVPSANTPITAKYKNGSGEPAGYCVDDQGPGQQGTQ